MGAAAVAVVGMAEAEVVVMEAVGVDGAMAMAAAGLVAAMGAAQMDKARHPGRDRQGGGAQLLGRSPL